MTMTDLLFDPTGGDLLIVNGDLVVGNAGQQHQRDLLYADKGHYKHQPTRGVGVTTYQNDVGSLPGLSGLIRTEFQTDGLTVVQLRVSSLGIDIDANY